MLICLLFSFCSNKLSSWYMRFFPWSQTWAHLRIICISIYLCQAKAMWYLHLPTSISIVLIFSGGTISSPCHKPLLSIAVSLVLAFLLLEFYHDMHQDGCILLHRSNCFQLGELEKIGNAHECQCFFPVAEPVGRTFVVLKEKIQCSCLLDLGLFHNCSHLIWRNYLTSRLWNNDAFTISIRLKYYKWFVWPTKHIRMQNYVASRRAKLLIRKKIKLQWLRY